MDDNCDCKCQESQFKFRIVGGEDALEDEFPYMVSLLSGTISCGGVLITSFQILTAAHCIKGFQGSSDLWALLGTLFYDYSDYEIPVSYMRAHQDFDPVTREHDIGIVGLQFYLEFNKQIQPACLSTDGEKMYSSTQMAVVVGWGYVEENGYLPNSLQKVEIPFVSHKSCVKAYDNLGIYVPENVICAGYSNGNKDSCQGDSGGPLIYYNPETKTRELIGIVSFGHGCARPLIPGIYTKVAHYLPWIKEKVGSSCLCVPSMTPKSSKNSRLKMLMRNSRNVTRGIGYV